MKINLFTGKCDTSGGLYESTCRNLITRSAFLLLAVANNKIDANG